MIDPSTVPPEFADDHCARCGGRHHGWACEDQVAAPVRITFSRDPIVRDDRISALEDRVEKLEEAVAAFVAELVVEHATVGR